MTDSRCKVFCSLVIQYLCIFSTSCMTELMRDEKTNFGFREDIEIHKKCISGLTFLKIAKLCDGDLRNMMDNSYYDVIIIQFGSNDYQWFRHRPAKLANKILKLARSIKKICHAKKVIICNVLARFKGNKKYSFSYSKAQEYRHWAYEVNKYSKSYSLTSNRILNWNHQNILGSKTYKSRK